MALTWGHAFPHTQSGLNSTIDITIKLFLEVKNIQNNPFIIKDSVNDEIHSSFGAFLIHLLG